LSGSLAEKENKSRLLKQELNKQFLFNSIKKFKLASDLFTLKKNAKKKGLEIIKIKN